MKAMSVVLGVSGLAIGFVASHALAQSPAGTAFTYQGQLKQAGVPVSGTVGGRFRLFDAETGGTEIGSVGPLYGEVVNGLFTVQLDFGAAAFDGEARWLEIELEFPVGAGNWTTLSPRQRLTPAPYASTALQAVGIDGHSLDAADGSPADAVFVNNDGRVMMNHGGLTVFDAVGQGIFFNTDSFYIGEGTSEDPVYEYSDTNDMHRFWTNGTVKMVIDADGNVGIGDVGDPIYPLQVFRDAPRTINAENIANNGYAVYGVATVGTGVFGRHMTSTGVGYGVHGDTSSTFTDAAGVLGEVSAAEPSSTAAGVRGVNNGPRGYGVYGIHSGSPGSGVHGWSIAGTGTSGYSSTGRGLSGTTPSGTGVYAESNGSTVNNPAIRANNTNGLGIGILSTTESADANTVLVNAGVGSILRGFSGDTSWELVFEVLNNGEVIVNNTDPDGIGILSTTESSDANLVVRNKGAGDIIRGFSGPDGWDMVFRVLNNGTTVTRVLHITGGADLSEGFEVSAGEVSAEPGTVVCIDPANAGNLIVCTKAYDRTVAGVISGAGGVKPGMVMGQQGSGVDGERPVALTGRVYVKCDAADGAIVPGDLLTTSSTPGYARKVADHTRAQGAILGKAMSSLSAGRGLVLVLVSLQ